MLMIVKNVQWVGTTMLQMNVTSLSKLNAYLKKEKVHFRREIL